MEIPYSAETDVGGNALHAILSVIRENSRRTARPRCSADHPSRLRAKIPMENGTLPLIIFGKTAKTASPPVFAGDSPSLGYAGLRCPGRSRDHLSAARAAERWTLAFAREAFNIIHHQEPDRPSRITG